MKQLNISWCYKCNIFFELSQIYSFALDTVAAISEKQKILQKQQQEIEEIEGNSDREVSFDDKCWRIIFRWRCYRRI